MAGPIASAVMLPESQDTEAPPPPALSPAVQKRRQSSISVSEQDAKRQRLSSVDTSADRGSSFTAKPSSATALPRRERGRERRLFGAALGALSQNSATAAQKRRSEIEKRQLAQRKLEEEESEQRKLEREGRRKAQRQKEQQHFERNSMRIRHDNLLSMAHFLRTESEPRLYYKPWETTPDQDHLIEDQIAEAQEIIRRELDEYEARQQPDEDAEGERHASRKGHAGRDAGAHPSTGKESNPDAPEQSPTAPAANGGTNGSGRPPKDPEQREDHAEGFTNETASGERAVANERHSSIMSHEATADEINKELMDENGEEVVEAAAEDTVIY